MSVEYYQEEARERGFDFTVDELEQEQVSDLRFQEMLDQEGTIIHRVDQTTNMLGEFIFIQISSPQGRQNHRRVTFYGLGFDKGDQYDPNHSHKGKWMTDTWGNYSSGDFTEEPNDPISRADLNKIIQDRKEEITPLLNAKPRS